jgi:hypothetical protein
VIGPEEKPFKSEKEWQTFRALAVADLGKTKDAANSKFPEKGK